MPACAGKLEKNTNVGGRLMNMKIQKIWAEIGEFMAHWCFLLFALLILGLGIWQWYLGQEEIVVILIFSFIIPAVGLYFFANYSSMEQDRIKKKNKRIRQEIDGSSYPATLKAVMGLLYLSEIRPARKIEVVRDRENHEKVVLKAPDFEQLQEAYRLEIEKNNENH